MYPGVVLFVTAMLCAFLFSGLVLFFDRSRQSTIYFRRIALLLSIITVILVFLGLCVELSQKAGQINFSEILFKAAAPLATISGFYMVYQNFILQKQYNEESEIRDHVKTRLDFHLKNVADFEMVDDSAKPNVVYKGRNAFKFFISKYISNYDKIERRWLFILVSSIENELIKEDLSTSEIDVMKKDWAKLKLADVWHFCETNSHLVYKDLSIGNKLKNRSQKHIYLIVIYFMLFFSEKTFLEWIGNNFDFEKIKKYDDSGKFRGFSKEDFNEMLTNLSGSTFSVSVVELNKEEGFVKGMGIESLDLQVFFGHYFRNLFGLYRYIDGIPNKDLKRKSEKMVKNQLSTYEQALVFLNSITPIGEKWELTDENKFFTKFYIIGNIPRGLLVVVDPEDFYPTIKFEYEDYS